MTPVICPTCGKSTSEGKFCENCGAPLLAPSSAPVAEAKKMKSVMGAAIGSFIFPGAGQVYNDQIGKAIGLYVVSIVIFLVGLGIKFPFIILLVMIFAAWDAYKVTTEMNAGTIPYRERSIAFVIGFLILEIIVIAVLVIMAAIVAAFVFGMAGSVQSAKSVAVTATKQGNTIVITYQGGKDSKTLSGLNYGIGTVDNSWSSPNVGDHVTLPGGASGNNHVIVLATFTDGTEQIILDTYV